MSLLNEKSLVAAADALKPLFRHGGSTGISYGWNAAAAGYGIWDHEHNDWFPDQQWAKDIRDIDGPRYFAERALRAAGMDDNNEETS